LVGKTNVSPVVNRNLLILAGKEKKKENVICRNGTGVVEKVDDGFFA
jgi:hypothetical protein